MARSPMSVRLAALVVTAVGIGACDGEGVAPTTPSASVSPAASRPATQAASGGPPTVRPAAPSGLAASPDVAATGFDLGAAEVVATGLDVPWAVAFLPNGDAVASERETGRIVRIARGGAPEEIARMEDIRAEGEGGLLGLAVSPTYADDSLLFAFTSDGRESRILRFRIGEPPETILGGIPASASHTGGRLAFGPDGMLYASVGDATRGELAQDASSLAGKILRIEPDGAIPSDNPDPGSAVWSLGHRNVEGFTWDDDGRMWATEFGEATADELNLIEAGTNYGWPEFEGGGDGEPEFRDPVLAWRPSVASPAGVAFVNGRLIVGALRGERLWAVPLVGAEVGQPTSALEGRFGRIRVVEVAPDGWLWLATSNRDGRGELRPRDDVILRVPPLPAGP